MEKKQRTLFVALVLTLAIPACGGRATTPEPTITPVKTATLEPVGINFAPYQDNPVLANGASGSWDAEVVFSGNVVFKGGLYHMFYNGSPSPTLQSVAIGYANSPDGLSFAKYASNPTFEADGSGFDAVQVGNGIPLVEENTWILYYNASLRPGPGPTIGRATAPDPSGPWTRDRDPVLTVGSQGEWDSGFVMPDSVIATDEGYVMYYSGGADWPGGAAAIGMATSPDGILWTKYNDPTTTAPPFVESDLVMQPGPPGSWDSDGVWGCTALGTPTGWEMFYSGSDLKSVQIGYATSIDGIHWTKHKDNPILGAETEPVVAEIESPILQSPSAIVNDSTYVLYYDYGISRSGIGMAMGTITRVP
jgi:hypothetical protein